MLYQRQIQPSTRARNEKINHLQKRRVKTAELDFNRTGCFTEFVFVRNRCHIANLNPKNTFFLIRQIHLAYSNAPCGLPEIIETRIIRNKMFLSEIRDIQNSPQTLQILKILNFLNFNLCALQIRFQQGFSGYPEMIETSVITYLVFCIILQTWT